MGAKEYLRGSHGVEVEVNQSWIEISYERDSNKTMSRGLCIGTAGKSFCVMMEGLTIDECVLRLRKLMSKANLREPISSPIIELYYT